MPAGKHTGILTNFQTKVKKKKKKIGAKGQRNKGTEGKKLNHEDKKNTKRKGKRILSPSLQSQILNWLNGKW